MKGRVKFEHPAVTKQAAWTLWNCVDNLHDMGEEEGDEYGQQLGFSGRDHMSNECARMGGELDTTGSCLLPRGRIRAPFLLWLTESMRAEAPIFEEDHGPDGLRAIRKETRFPGLAAEAKRAFKAIKR